MKAAGAAILANPSHPTNGVAITKGISMAMRLMTVRACKIK